MSLTTKSKAKADSVFKTDDGADLLLDPKDPKYKKPRKKIDVKDELFAKQDGNDFEDLKIRQKERKQHPKLRPIVGWLCIPYIILYRLYKLIGLPILRLLAAIGNVLYYEVFKERKGDTTI